MTATAPLLIFGVGNPSRGDDALGPLFVERLGQILQAEVVSGKLELLTDFQLQIEHAMDLVGRKRALFVDASLEATPPFSIERVYARRDASHTSHAMSPQAVLHTHRQVVGNEPPESWVLGIRGERFALGEPLSETARAGLEAALSYGQAWVCGEAEAEEGRCVFVMGAVQGVGLRPWIARQARRMGLRGCVYNTSAGVVVEAAGSPTALDALEEALLKRPPQAARIHSLRTTARSPKQIHGASFEIAFSHPGGARRLPLPADLTVCAECLADMGNPADRHYGYALVSCPACGPRYSLVTELPYDRAHTTLAGFVPCPACATSYNDPEDRRYHAQTLACPACGPHLFVVPQAEGDALTTTADRILAGQVVALRGLGAFHLSCDATNEVAVASLRKHKRRQQKPFAVMVADLEMAEQLAVFDTVARDALTHPARPIVLLQLRRRPSKVVPGVLGSTGGPLGGRIGLMLPYTPLHHQLLRAVGRPLVMTSGNLSGAPVVINNEEAMQVLGESDAFLLHNRPIARRVEDSVVQLSWGGVQILRRARGYAPRPLTLPASSPEPVLAVGGHLKNTVCLVLDDQAYLSPHLGDLDTVESLTAWQEEVGALERLLGVEAKVLAYDLHPEYAVTRWALGRNAKFHHGVQHHVAHTLAAVAELGLTGPVLGVVYDGSGWGPDGTLWGGEFLLVDGSKWQRVASLRPFPLLGGEVAIRGVFRQALALLVDAFGEEALEVARHFACFAEAGQSVCATLVRALSCGVQTVFARGVGRYFDGLGALVTGFAKADYEGQVAMALEEAAEGESGPPYPWTWQQTEGRNELDLRRTVRALVKDLQQGVSAGRAAARIHQTMIDATAEGILQTGVRQVVLSGGVFQNRRLFSGLLGHPFGFPLHVPRELPVNDGGLSLGQAWSAVLTLLQQVEG